MQYFGFFAGIADGIYEIIFEPTNTIAFAIGIALVCVSLLGMFMSYGEK